MKIRQIILSLLGICTIQLSANNAYAEWKEVANFIAAPAQLDFTQCDLRLRHNVNTIYNNEISMEYNYYPLSRSNKRFYNNKTFLKYNFNLQPGLLPNTFTYGTNKSLTPEDSDRIYKYTQSLKILRSDVEVSISTGAVPYIALVLQGFNAANAIDGQMFNLTPTNFALEADCPKYRLDGDANNDGCVDNKDAYIWYGNYLLRTTTNTNFGLTADQGDFDKNGKLEYADLTVYSQNYKRGCDAQFQNVGPGI